MKTILIPTDFNPTSVHSTDELLKSLAIEPVRIIYFHTFKITDSITDLLMLKRRTADYAYIPESFHAACYELQKCHQATINLLSIEYFYGSTMAAFRNFAEANEISHVFLTEGYHYEKISRYSLDPTSFLQRSGIPQITIQNDVNSDNILEQELIK